MLTGCAGMSRQYQEDTASNAIGAALAGAATGAALGAVFGHGHGHVWKPALGGATLGAYVGALGTQPRQQRRGQREVVVVQPQYQQPADIDCSAFSTEEERQACERGRVQWLKEVKKARLRRAYRYGRYGGN